MKMTILSKANYRYNRVPTNLPILFCTEPEQIISLFVWKHKRSQIAKAILGKKTQLEESTFLTSDYTTKLQASRQFGAGTKTEI